MAKLFCLMGLPGAGKSTVMYELYQKYADELIILPRITDRAVRQDELPPEENPEYSFISKKWFKILQRNKAFAAIEYLADYHYAVRLDDIQRVCSDGCPGIVMAGYCGLEIQKQYPEDVFSIFLAVPKVDLVNNILTLEAEAELIWRMKQRGDSNDQIHTRINLAHQIIETDQVHCNSDYIIEHEYGKLEQTMEKFKRILFASS